ncbi:MAG TPA: hypothetical protein VH307_03210 [Streptosporangiaceae bacterium]|nr:hypothetical protein [Streptosporangiaceae bacterium]
MTRTEERLADALGAAARALHEDTLRPLLVPDRPRRHAAWAAPAAAAAGLLLVVGLAVALAGHLPGSGSINGAGSLPRFYVEAGFSGARPEVRSTATGAVTDRVPVPNAGGALVPYLLTAAGNGDFFVAVNGPPVTRLYRFRLNAAGQVRGLRQVPGGTLGNAQWAADAMAASPDGSQVAVSLGPRAAPGSTICSPSGRECIGPPSDHSDHIYVVNTATGARSFWHGGIGQSSAVSVLSLSWTRNGTELAYFAQWCPQGRANTFMSCARGTRTGGATAEVRAINPASGGGALTSGRRLFQLSATFPNVPQAVISPDGSTITAAVLTGSGGRWHTPTALAVEQISIATGKPLRVLYRQHLSGAASINSTPDYVTLSPDTTGKHWLLSTMNGSVPCGSNLNGWIDGGQLVPLPAGCTVVAEAW